MAISSNPQRTMQFPSPLSDAIAQMKELKSAPASDEKFSTLIYKKLEEKSQAVTIPEGRTSCCALRHGFAVGFPDGTVCVVLPPCAQHVRLCQDAVKVLVRFDDDLLAFTASRSFFLSLHDLGVREYPELPQEVTAGAVYQSSKEVVLGLASGDVVMKTGFSDQTREWELERHFPSELQNYAVKAVYVVEDESWFAVKYDNFSEPIVIIWKREDATKLHHLRSSQSAKVPIAIPPRVDTPVPLYSHLAVDSANLTYADDAGLWKDQKHFRLMLDHGIVWDVQSSLSKLDFIEHKARGKNWATLRTLDFCVIFLPQDQYGCLEWINTEVNEDIGIADSIMRLDTNFDYQDCLTSEDGLYLCLIGQTEVKVLTVCAVEATFTHALNLSETQVALDHVLHYRFNTYFDDKGNVVVPSDQMAVGNVEFSEDKEFYSISNSREWRLYSRGTRQMVLGPVSGVKRWLQSQFDTTVVLVCQDEINICDTASSLRASIAAPGVAAHSNFFWKPGPHLFAFSLRQHATHYSPSTVSAKLAIADQHFEQVVEVHTHNCDFLLMYADRTDYYSWEVDSVTHHGPAYTDMKPFANGEFCATVSDRVTFVLSLPDMTEVLKFRWSDCLAIDRTMKVFLSYSTDPKDEKFGVVKVWDLEVGIYTKTIDTGLKGCAEIVGQRLGSVLQQLTAESTHRPIEYQNPHSPVICRLWKFDFPRDSQVGFNSNLLRFIGTESLAAYCCSLKRLTSILYTHKETQASLDPLSCRVTVRPFNINILHLLSSLNNYRLILPAFRLSAKFLKSTFGTPITLCFSGNRKQDECLDALLEGLVELRESDSAEFLAALHQLSNSDDFERIIKSQSQYLGTFLESVLVPLPREVIPVSQLLHTAMLPLPRLQGNLLQPRMPFSLRLPFQELHTHRHYALICPIGLHLSMDTPEGKSLLLALRDSDPTLNVLSQKVIGCLATVKWNTVRVRWLLLSGIYWALLALIVCRVYDYGDQRGIGAAILALNSFLAVIEVIQMSTSFLEYINSFWNFVDVVRIAFTFPFAVVSLRIWLTFLVVSVSAIRGLTTFEAIDSTRFLVKMILKACRETVFFVLVFVYSNLCFGVLLKVSQEDDGELNFFESWRESFELSMGGFDNSGSNALRWMVFFAACLVNVIWMLNLLISILGTAYENFTIQIQAENVKTQFELVAEMGQLTRFWNSHTPLQYLFIFDKRPKGENPRNEQVTLFSLREEMDTRDAAMNERMDRVERKLEELLQAVKETAVRQQLARM